MGRAPGGDRVSSSLLNPSNTFSEESYLRQLEHLQAYFSDEAGTQYGPVLAVPQAESVPEQWILSSSGGSASIAARYGLGLAIARFINGFATPDIVQIYKQEFRPSAFFPEPQVLVAVSVFCAETEEKAAELRKLSDFILIQFEKGNFSPLYSYEDIKDYQFSAEELMRVERNRSRVVSGTPGRVKEQLLQLARDFEAEEIMVSTMAYAQEDRVRSFELLAEAFELTPAAGA
jgi:luciferase family oxidoreductase group 1